MGSLFSRDLCCTRCCNQSLLKREPSFSEVLTCPLGNDPDGPPKQYSWDKRPKLNPSDYTISNLEGQQSVKFHGDIKGQQFIIKNCSNARIYLFDFSSQVTIDDCNDCLVVLGPVQGSVFLRDTKNTTLVCASSQLRLRDCQNINLFVGCESDPIIEASTEVITAPYFLSYKGIADHFKSANLSRFKSVRWAEIYDFTPNDITPNWKIYDREKCDPQKYICPPTEDPLSSYMELEISVGEKDNLLSNYIPITHPEIDGFLEDQVWRKQETTFNLEGQGKEVLEQFMEKFYTEKFINGQNPLAPTAILCDIQTNNNQFTFTYFQL